MASFLVGSVLGRYVRVGLVGLNDHAEVASYEMCMGQFETKELSLYYKRVRVFEWLSTSLALD